MQIKIEVEKRTKNAWYVVEYMPGVEGFCHPAKHYNGPYTTQREAQEMRDNMLMLLERI